MKEKVAQFAKQYLKEDVPEFKVGDTVAASVRIIEGSKERIQVFQGVCIARRHSGIDETLTIRKISFQVGVERTFFLNSPRLAGLEVKRRGRAVSYTHLRAHET